jgi:hypothetical protein
MSSLWRSTNFLPCGVLRRPGLLKFTMHSLRGRAIRYKPVLVQRGSLTNLSRFQFLHQVLFQGTIFPYTHERMVFWRSSGSFTRAWLRRPERSQRPLRLVFMPLVMGYDLLTWLTRRP